MKQIIKRLRSLPLFIATVLSAPVPTHAQQGLNVIDTSNDTFSQYIHVVYPTFVRTSPDGAFVYIGTALDGVQVLDSSSYAFVGGIPVDAVDVGATPDGTRAYVTTGPDVAVVDTSTWGIVDRISTRGDRIAITPDGTRAYLGLRVIDTDPQSETYNTVIATLPVGGRPSLSPDGNFLYLTGSNTVYVVDTNPGSKTYHNVLARVDVGRTTFDAAITPDGSRVYVTGQSVTGEQALFAIDADTFTVFDTLAVRGLWIVTHPDGSRAYDLSRPVTTVLDIDPSSPTFHQVIRTLPIVEEPVGIAIRPDGAYVYVATICDFC